MSRATPVPEAQAFTCYKTNTITTSAVLEPGFANLAEQPRKVKVNLMHPLRLREVSLHPS